MKNIKVLICLFSLFLMASTSSFAQKKRVKGSGPVVNEIINVSNFSAIGLGISANVYLSQGSKHSVEVQGQRNIIDILEIESNSGTLKIRVKKGYNYNTNEKLEVHVTMPDLTGLAIGGSGSIYGQNKFSNLESVNIAIGGSGSVDIDLEARDVSCNIGGSGSAKIAGQTKDIKINIGGSGSVKALDLVANNADINCAGSGSVKLEVKDHIDAKIAGSGGVKYKGSPTIDSKVVGSGRIKSY